MRGSIWLIAAVARRLGTGLLLLAAGSLASPALAADDGPDYVGADLQKACDASGTVCRTTCNESYRGKRGFSAQLGYDLCRDGCERNYSACLGSIPAAAQTGGQAGVDAGSVLDPGPRRPPKQRPSVSAPAADRAVQ